jgi:hypothetical protein
MTLCAHMSMWDVTKDHHTPMSTYVIRHLASDMRGVKKDHHMPMSTYGVQRTTIVCVNVWGTSPRIWYAWGERWDMPHVQCQRYGSEKYEGDERLTVSATRTAVSKRVGKSSFSIKELTEGVSLDALDKCRHMRILSGSPGACD